MRTLLTIPRPAIAWAHPNGRQPTIPAMLSAFSAGPGPVHMPKRQLGAIAGLIAFSIQVGNHSPLQIFLSHQSLGPVHETQNIPHRAGDSSGLKVDIALDLMISIPETFRIWRAALPFDEISIGFGGIRLLTLAELKEPQIGYRESLEGNDLCTGAPGDWRSDWVVIGEDTCVGDPLILDASSKALAVLTVMHGQGQWDPYPVAASLDGFNAALQAIVRVSYGRENPVALERNPIVQEERDGHCLSSARRIPVSTSNIGICCSGAMTHDVQQVVRRRRAAAVGRCAACAARRTAPELDFLSCVLIRL
jgi:hypothetical protein